MFVLSSVVGRLSFLIIYSQYLMNECTNINLTYIVRRMKEKNSHIRIEAYIS